MNPSDEDLRQFLLGLLPPSRAAVVADWVEHTPDAADALRKLHVSDPLVAALSDRSNTPTPLGTLTITAAVGVTPEHPIDTELRLPSGYRYVRELGRGGMGVVFEAIEEPLGRRVAVKVMRPEIAALRTAKVRFLREARLMAAVEDDHIVPVFRVDETADGSPFLVMPLLLGQTLADKLKEGNLSTAELIRIARDAADGLAAAHARGLIHRDIKPSNLWLEAARDGTFRRVRILDFGLAREEEPATELTGSGQVSGTPAYMSPEQARGETLDRQTDLFSLGTVLYRAATGRLPFAGETASAVLTALAVENPPSIRELNPTMPTALEKLIAKLLAKKQAERPSSAAEIIAELDRIATLPPDPIPQAAVARKPNKPRRRFQFAVAAGLLASCLVALGGWVVIKIRNQDGTETALKVPSSTEVTVGPDGVVTVALPRDRGASLSPLTGMTERASAEWVIRNGGGIACFVPAVNRNVDVRNLEELPTQPFVAYGVWLSGNATGRVTDDAIANLGGLSKVRTLFIDRQPLTDKGWEQLLSLPGFRSLWEITLADTDLTPQAIRAAAELPELSSLLTRITVNRAEDLAPLKGCHKLKRLTFHTRGMPATGYTHLRGLGLNLLGVDGGGSPLPAEFLDAAASLPALTTFELTDWDASRADFSSLRRLRYLTNFGSTKIELPPDGFAPLAAWPALTEVRSISLGKNADAHLANLGKVPKLGTLMFNQSPMATDAGLDALHETKSLGLIECWGCPKLTAEGIRRLSAAVPKCLIKSDHGAYQDGKPLSPSPTTGNMAARRKAAIWARGKQNSEIHLLLPDGRWISNWEAEKLPPDFSIGKLAIQNDPTVTDAALQEHLPGLDGLRDLDVSGCAVTDESLMLAAKLSHLTRLQVGRLPGMTDRTLAALSGHKSLTELGTCSNRFTGAGLAHLKTIPNLKRFGIWKVAITDKWLEAIGSVDSLEALWIEDLFPDSRVTLDGIASLKNLKRLKKLVLRGTEIDDAWLVPCAGMTVLEELDLLSTRVSDDGLTHLSDLPRLAQLSLAGSRVTGAGMKHLAKCPALWNLWLFGLPIDDDGAVHLAASPSLKRVILRGSLITDKGAIALAKVPTLEEFGGQECRLTDVALEALAANPRVVAIGASGPKITDRGVAALAKNPNLSVLVLPDTAVTDASVPALSGLKKLNRLELPGTKVTPAGFVALKKAFPNVEIAGTPAVDMMAERRKTLAWLQSIKAEVHLLLPGDRWLPPDQIKEPLPPEFEIGRLSLVANPTVTDADLKAHLPGLDGLRHLDIAACPKVTDDAMTLLVKFPKIKWLGIGSQPGVTDRTYAALAGHPALTTVALNHTELNDAAFAGFAAAPVLYQLNINMGHDRTLVTAKGLAELQRSTSLHHLMLANVAITPHHLRAIGRIAGLGKLEVNQCQIPVEGFDAVAGLQKLTQLHLSETNVGDSHMRKLPPLATVTDFAMRSCLIGDEGLAGLEKWSRLATLTLDRTEVKGGGLKHLAKCPKLEHVNLDGNPVSSAGLVALAASPSLQQLRIQGTPMTDEAADSLATMPKLEWLHAFGSGVTERQCKALVTSPSLARLGLSGPQVGDGHVKLFAEKPQFTQLAFVDSNVTDWSYPVLKGMKHLTWLDLLGSRVTPTGVGAIRKALPKCAVLPEGPTPVNLTEGDRRALQWAVDNGAEVGVVHFNDFGRGLTLKKSTTEIDDYLWMDWLIPSHINFHRRPVLDLKTIDNLKGLSSLRNLSLERQPLGDEGLAKLAVMPVAKTITSLWAGEMGMTDAGAKHLPAFVAVSALHLHGNRLTAEGATHLRKLPKLSVLSWEGTLTDETLGALKGMPLTEVHIPRNPALTDAGLMHLAAFPTLAYLSIGSPALTDAGLAKSLTTLPNLQRIWLGCEQVGPKTLTALGNCKKLAMVELVGLPLSIDQLKALRLPPLATDLWFREIPGEVSNQAVDCLAEFKQLKAIVLSGSKVREEQVKRLSIARPEILVRSQQGNFLDGEKK